MVDLSTDSKEGRTLWRRPVRARNGADHNDDSAFSQRKAPAAPPSKVACSSCVPVNRFCSVRRPVSRVRLQLRRKVAKLRRQRCSSAIANSDTRRTLQLRWLLESHVEVGRRPDLSLEARGWASVPRGAQWHGDETPVPTPTAARGADQQAIHTCASLRCAVDFSPVL